MQTTPAIAALLDPFAAPQGGVQGAGPMSGPLDDATDKKASNGEFGDALAAAMAAALGQAMPVPPASTPVAPAKGEGADQALPGRAQAAPAALAPLIATSDASPSDESPVAPVAVPMSADIVAAGSTKVPDTGATAPQGFAATPAPAHPLTPGSASSPPANRPATVELALNHAPAPTEVETQARLENPVQARTAAQTEVQTGTPTQTPPQVQSPTPAQVQAPVLAASLPAAATPSTAASTPSPSITAEAAPTAAPAPSMMAVAATANAAAPAPTSPAQLAPPRPQGTAQAQAQAQADTNSRSAKAKAAAPAEGRNTPQTAQLDAGASASTKPEIKAGADDNPQHFSSTVDDQPEQAEAQTERPALAAAAPGVTEHRAVNASVAEAPRATPQTVALLAAQISSKLDGKSTRFDVQLDPHGLGKVDVRVEISARGDVSAALTFENPHAASELRSRSGELQTALEQAGFDLTKTSLSFNSGGQGQHQSLFDQQQNQAPVWRGRAFTDLSDTPEAAPAPVQRRAAAGGVDVRI